MLRVVCEIFGELILHPINTIQRSKTCFPVFLLSFKIFQDCLCQNIFLRSALETCTLETFVDLNWKVIIKGDTYNCWNGWKCKSDSSQSRLPSLDRLCMTPKRLEFNLASNSQEKTNHRLHSKLKTNSQIYLRFCTRYDCKKFNQFQSNSHKPFHESETAPPPLNIPLANIYIYDTILISKSGIVQYNVNTMNILIILGIINSSYPLNTT